MIAGRAVTGDMEGPTGNIRIHDGCALFCYRIYQRTDRKFVARYWISGEDHHIIWLKSYFFEFSSRYACHGRVFLALASRYQKHDLIALRVRYLVYLDFSSPFDMQISEFLCDAFGFDDGSPDKTDFTVELFRRLNRLVQTGHIGRIGRDKDLSLIVTHRFFKILCEHLFRGSKSGSFRAKAIRKQCRDAFLCGLCYFGKFRPFPVSRSQIEFVVRSMVEVASRSFNEKVSRIWYGVCDMDKGDVEITDLHGARSKWNRLDNRMRMEFGQFFIGKSGCERRSKQRERRQLRQNIRQAADMIFVSMGQQHT